MQIDHLGVSQFEIRSDIGNPVAHEREPHYRLGQIWSRYEAQRVDNVFAIMERPR